MLSTSSFAVLATAFSTMLSFNAGLAAPAPAPQASSSASSGSSYWMANVDHTQDSVWGNAGFKVFRNVKDYGATGDGSTDDTNAIQSAFNTGNRCGLGCNSSTTTPAIIWFPAGTYVVSLPIKMDYYSVVVGDPTNMPTLQAKSNFTGMALLDADPYENGGVNWFINQNNFFRQIRNFVIDLTKIEAGTGAAIHWQVAQATSLQNIVFNMIPGSQQIGIFMDNGSGGWMSDLIFNGGKIGAFLGNQQFTSRNLTFKGCQTAIFMNWNWGWTLMGLTIDGTGSGIDNATGIDMSNSPTNQTVGSIVVADSSMTGVKYGIKSAYQKSGNVPATGGSLVIDNVNFASGSAVADVNGDEILAAGSIKAWASGNGATNGKFVTGTQGTITQASKDASLLDSNGHIYGKSKPQYENTPASSFVSVKSAPYNAKGDGTTDDTAAIQNLLNATAAAGTIAYFPLGAYKVTNTIVVPPGAKIVGSIWPTILASGFTDVNNPKPVFQIGSAGQSGTFEMTDMLFGVLGPNPGAIMIQWNMQCKQGGCGMWDSHSRIGGSYGTNLQYDKCAKNPSQTGPSTGCEGAFLMFHASSSAQGVYLENSWHWTADHDMEDALNRQISVYNTRGVLIEGSTVWLWGTASEHSILYNYQLTNAKNVWAGLIQTETPYFQPNPAAPGPYQFNSQFDDPTFTVCSGGNSSAVPCKDAWGLRVLSSSGVVMYSTGFYNFFNNYDQTCVGEQNCQQNMIHIQDSQVDMYCVTTKASVNMILDDAYSSSPITDAQNRDVYGATIAYYFTNS